MIQARLIAYGLFLAVLIGLGFYVRHLYKEAHRVPDLVHTINILQKQKDAERESAKKALEQEADIRKQLASVDKRSALLARRLRESFNSRLPQTPSDTSSPDGTSGDGISPSPTDVDSAINGLLAACQRDALRLMQWQTYYEAIPPELK